MTNIFWGTPNFILDRFQSYFDPCPFPLPSWDGLEIPWEGNVYVNPPFSKMKYWTKKCLKEILRDPNRKIVLLTPVDRLYNNYMTPALKQCDFEIITQKVKLLTISMGSGSTCDGQYLFSQDVLGYTKGHMPRHARIYRDFSKEFEKLHQERVNAYKEYINDVEEKKFNDPKITVGINDKEFDKFINLAEKI